MDILDISSFAIFLLQAVNSKIFLKRIFFQIGQVS